MDLSSSCNAAAAATVKTPEAETETTPAATRIYPAKPLSYSSNGVLKRLNNPLRRRPGDGAHYAVTPEAETETTPAATRIYPAKPLSYSSNGVLKRLNNPLRRRPGDGAHYAVVVHYRECLKNHAAALGGHAVDGCGEFMTSPAANPADPTSLKCAACGCHRNFHRREIPDDALSPPESVPAIEYQPYHRHHPPPPPQDSHSSPPSSPSPPPISSSYYPSAPHVLLALSTGITGPPHLADNNNNNTATPTSAADHQSSMPGSNPSGRKRFRTKFTQDQKDKMAEFAEKVGWKIQKRDEDLINNFCSDIGVERVVFKVWMHNNKNISGKKDHPIAAAANYSDDNAGHGMNFNLLSAKNYNLDSPASATCHFDVKNENKNNGVSAPAAAAANGSYYSS
ncbi:unnamed protein product [Cuscuta campestris]|uniref:ZF-HD dimerization-type domain-containing protein n=1 Tax=Cuscuta campestris TaxID=132261 RepID=A0A484N7A4_9ASTE|nr:unnamed protein product [Cuscuta campestris]